MSTIEDIKAALATLTDAVVAFQAPEVPTQVIELKPGEVLEVKEAPTA